MPSPLGAKYSSRFGRLDALTARCVILPAGFDAACMPSPLGALYSRPQPEIRHALAARREVLPAGNPENRSKMAIFDHFNPLCLMDFGAKGAKIH